MIDACPLLRKTVIPTDGLAVHQNSFMERLFFSPTQEQLEGEAARLNA